MKPIHSTYLIPGLYPKSPILIQDIEFTPRQWDIISAFYHVKKPLLVGSLLGIGNKGVEAHIYNIKQKLPFQRKDLLLFLDTCAATTRESLQKHYRYLLIEKTFQETFKNLKLKRLTYEWNPNQSVSEEFPLTHINNHLALAGMMLVQKEQTPDLILDYEAGFSDPKTYYTSFVHFFKSILSEEETQDVFKDLLQLQEDTFVLDSSQSGEKPITHEESPYLNQKFFVSEKQDRHIKISSFSSVDNGSLYLGSSTKNGKVSLVHDAEAFNIEWELIKLGGDICAFKSRGADSVYKYLDGCTIDGSLYLSPSLNWPYTGTRWHVIQNQGFYVFRCLGHLHTDEYLFLSAANGLTLVNDDTDPMAHWSINTAE